jgi:hypothetical protein
MMCGRFQLFPIVAAIAVTCAECCRPGLSQPSCAGCRLDFFPALCGRRADRSSANTPPPVGNHARQMESLRAHARGCHVRARDIRSACMTECVRSQVQPTVDKLQQPLDTHALPGGTANGSSVLRVASAVREEAESVGWLNTPPATLRVRAELPRSFSRVLMRGGVVDASLTLHVRWRRRRLCARHIPRRAAHAAASVERSGQGRRVSPQVGRWLARYRARPHPWLQ